MYMDKSRLVMEFVAALRFLIGMEYTRAAHTRRMCVLLLQWT